MEKLYVNEIRPDSDISTVGLFYSRAEAEHVVARLRSILEKSRCRYVITETPPTLPSTSQRRRTDPSRKV